MTDVYFNEIDALACAVLRECYDGFVDERSVADVQVGDIGSFRIAHFFAGAGLWEVARRFAGWPDDRELWTASLPCQPFSGAGKQRGKNDERHLLPEFLRLVRDRRPAVIVGEQVSSGLGKQWFGGDPGLQRMLDREAAHGVLQASSVGGVPETLQKLFSVNRGRAGKYDPRPESSGSESLQEEIQGEGTDPSGEAESAEERFALQLGRGAYSRCHRCGRLRVDGHSLQFGWRKDLGQSIAGQDRTEERLFPDQCACGAPLHQCDGERVGREQDRRDSRGDHEGSARGVAGFPGSPGIRIEAAHEFESLSGMRIELEALGYAVGCADLPACGVGAPHRRSRLWWVAIRIMEDALRGRAIEDGRDAGKISDVPEAQRQSGYDAALSGGEHDAGLCAMADAEGLRQRSGADEPGQNSRSWVELAGTEAWRDAVDGGSDGGAVGDADGAGGEACDYQSIGTGARSEQSSHPDAEPVADADQSLLRQVSSAGQQPDVQQDARDHGGHRPLADASGERRREGRPERPGRVGIAASSGPDGAVDMGDALREGLERQRGNGDDCRQPGWIGSGQDGPIATADGSFWSDAVWLRCADGRTRRAPRQSKCELRSLADGLAGSADPRGDASDPEAQVDYSLLTPSKPGRADLWRLVGNSIVPQLAAAFLSAVMEAIT